MTDCILAPSDRQAAVASLLSVLTTKQTTTLRKLEGIVERGLKTFMEVGAALKQIRDEKLYLDYETFEDYCKERWGFKKGYARYLIEGAKVTENLKVHNCELLPATESQARPLAQLPTDQQVNAWQDAVDECRERGEPITAAVVADVVEKYKAQAKPNCDQQADADEAAVDEQDTIEDDHPFSMGNCIVSLRKEACRWLAIAPDSLKGEIIQTLRDIATQLEMKIGVKAAQPAAENVSSDNSMIVAPAEIPSVSVVPATSPACPNCGGAQFDEDGDCASCREPHVVAATGSPTVTFRGKSYAVRRYGPSWEFQRIGGDGWTVADRDFRKIIEQQIGGHADA